MKTTNQPPSPPTLLDAQALGKLLGITPQAIGYRVKMGYLPEPCWEQSPRWRRLWDWDEVLAHLAALPKQTGPGRRLASNPQ